MSINSELLIAILQHSDELYQIRVYETTYFNLKHEIFLGDNTEKDISDKYIKAQRIIQNHDCTLFCVPYLEDGMFMLCFFTADKLLSKDNISKRLKLENHYIRPNDNFPNPLIDACFLDINFKFNKKGNPVKENMINEKMLINVFLSHEN
jgi:hypothetical protein